MNTISQRHFSRNDCCLPIKYATLKDCKYSKSTLYNISKTGMYFESARKLKPKSNITIIMPKRSLPAAGSGWFHYYLGQIIWCRRIQGESGTCFGYGVRLSKCGQQEDGEDAQEICQLCDMCNTAAPCDEIKIIDDHIYLCTACYTHFNSLPDGYFKNDVIRFLKGNVV